MGWIARVADPSEKNEQHDCWETTALEAVRLCDAEPIVDTGTRKLTHVGFCFQVGRKFPLTGERDIVPVIEIYMTLPCPGVGIRISAKYPDEGLVTV